MTATRCLLDSVAFLWALKEPERLSRRARKVIEQPESRLEFSAASIAEIAIKSSTGKLGFDRADVLEGINELQLTVLPIRAEHTFRLFRLPMHHRDPFDRLIISQALTEGIPVVTSDESFRAYEVLTVIW